LALGFGIIYSTVEANRRGDYLRLENEVLRVDLPISWFTILWEDINETTNERIYYVITFPHDRFSVISIQVFDEKATKQFLNEDDRIDLPSISFLQTQRFFYEWASKKGENASIISVENGTLYVEASGEKASYTRIHIKDGYKADGSLYNVTVLVVSYMRNNNLVQISFWGKQEDYEKNLEVFEWVLNNTLVKKYGPK